MERAREPVWGWRPTESNPPHAKMSRGKYCGANNLFTSIGLQEGIDFHVVLFHVRADLFEGFVYVICKLYQFVLFGIDHAPAHHGAKIQDLFPIAPPIDQNHVV